MKTEIVPFETDHARSIIERNEKEGKKFPSNGIDLNDVMKAWKDGGPAYTLIIDGEVVVSSGVVLMGWKRGEAWTLLSSLFYKFKKESYKAIKEGLEGIVKKEGLRRVQSMIKPDLESGPSWMKHLGFTYEVTLEAFGPNGEDFDLYKRIYRGIEDVRISQCN